jgi:endogenous inhibitor of DNA gyrase (YacG/DUF329 family)
MESNVLSEVLDNKQINEIVDYLNNTYEADIDIDDVCDQDWYNAPFCSDLCVIDFTKFPYEDYRGNGALLVNRNGEIIDNHHDYLRILGKDLILYKDTKASVFHYTFWTSSGGAVIYTLPVDSGILDCHGNIIFSGDFGDISRARLDGDYIFLEKDQFTDLEKDKIKYYFRHIAGGKDAVKYDNTLLCPLCEGNAHWDDEWKYFCCKDVLLDIEMEPPLDDWFLNEMQMMASDQFRTVLNLDALSDERFTPDDENYLSMLAEEDTDDDPHDEHESNPLDGFINDKVYSLYSIRSKKVVIPFQPCAIRIGKEPYEYFLSDRRGNGHSPEWVRFGKFTKLKESIAPGYGSPTPFVHGDAVHVYEGMIFNTIADTFRGSVCTGKTLSMLFGTAPTEILKLVKARKIFISNVALYQLCQRYGDKYRNLLLRLIRERDKMLYNNRKQYGHCSLDCECGIFGVDQSTGKYCLLRQSSFYETYRPEQIFSLDPDYIIDLIYNKSIIVGLDFLEMMWGGLEWHTRISSGWKKL